MNTPYRVALFALLCLACGTPPANAPGQAVANAEVVRRLLHELWVERNAAVMDELLVPDYRYHYNDFDTPGESLEEARQGIERDFQEYSDIAVRIVNLFTTDDRGALQWVWRATHNQSQRQVEIQSNTIYRFRAGRIAEAWDAYDYTGVALQLGYRLLPPDSAP